MAESRNEWIGSAIVRSIEKSIMNACSNTAKKTAQKEWFKSSAEQYGYIRWVLYLFEATREEIDMLKGIWFSGMNDHLKSEFNKLASLTTSNLKKNTLTDVTITAHEYAYERYKMKGIEGTPKGEEEKKKLKETFLSKMDQDERQTFMKIASGVYKILDSTPISKIMANATSEDGDE